MIRVKINLFIIIIAFLIAGCGDNSYNDVNSEFLDSSDFTFSTTIDSTTLTQEDNFRIHESFTATRDEAYAIQNDEDLEAFNQTLTENEQVSLNDLDVYTYFFIRSPGCPEYFDYDTHSYANNMLTITLDHFQTQDAVCAQSIEELYVVFKANKNS